VELELEDVILLVRLLLHIFQVDQAEEALITQFNILELLDKEILVDLDIPLLELKKVLEVVELEVQVQMQVLLQEEMVEVVQVLLLYLAQH
jgi:hypothetical protein